MRPNTALYHKILVVGPPGAGKSTLATAVADRLTLPYSPVNWFRWQTDWKATPASQFNRLIDGVLNQAAWVMDDNVQGREAEIWPQADCVIWLDYSLAHVLARIARRNLSWWLTGKMIWGVNQMTLGRALGGILEAAREHGATRRRIAPLLRESSRSQSMRFTEPHQATQWLSLLRQVEVP